MRKFALAAIVALASSAIAAGPAIAGDSTYEATDYRNAYTKVAATSDDTRTENVWVLDESTAVHNGESTFYPLPQEARGSLKVTEEVAESMGTVQVGKLSPSKAKELKTRLKTMNSSSAYAPSANTSTDFTTFATSYWTPFYAYANGNWGPWSTRSGALIGTTSSTTWVPRWEAAPGSIISGAICGQAVGYYESYGWGGYGVYSQLYNVGCTSGARSVPWGNVAANPQFRATTYASLGGGGRFM